MSAATELMEALTPALAPISVSRLGDRGRRDDSEDFVNIQLTATEYPDLDVCSPVVISETVSVVAWSTGGAAGAEQLADKVEQAVFSSGLKTKAEGRSEIFDAERFGAYSGVELSYRIWR